MQTGRDRDCAVAFARGVGATEGGGAAGGASHQPPRGRNRFGR